MEHRARVIVVGHPIRDPASFAVLDMDTGESIGVGLTTRLMAYDVIAGPKVKPLLAQVPSWKTGRARFVDLSLPRAVSMEGVIRSSCGIAEPFVSAETLRLAGEMLEDLAVMRALERKAASLAAMYRYSLLHGRVLLRTSLGVKEIEVPWLLPGEGQELAEVCAQAARLGVDVLAVVLPAREARTYRVRGGELIDEQGQRVQRDLIVEARLAVTVH